MLQRCGFAFLLWLAAVNGVHADFVLSDIQTWVGTGSNQAGFVVDFKNGTATSSLAWGYRWDGSATGEQMLRAIAASDNAGLRANLGSFGGFGYFVNGFGYDANHNGVFGTSPALDFADPAHKGVAYGSNDPSRTATDSGDVYREGGSPDPSYWSYWTKPTATDTWTNSNIGMSSRTLANGNWDGWSFEADFNDPSSPAAPDTPVAAVPEPGPLLLLSLPLIIAMIYHLFPSLARRANTLRHRAAC